MVDRLKGTQPENVKTWSGFMKKIATLDHRWIFRGDLESHGLVTSLERACESWNVPLKFAPKIEGQLVREFKRHPETVRLGLEDDDDLCWLTAMQHYGAPTRLLDWTYSPFVAAHFAFDKLLSTLPNDASGKPQRAAVWALDTNALSDALKRGVLKKYWRLYQKKESKPFTKLYVNRRRPIRFIGIVNPLRLNERLSIQQGLFLCPGDIRHSWAKNLEASRSKAGTTRLFVMEPGVINDAFKALSRMNVTSRSLLPGLDGYAKSLLHR
jgi:hypothetical protein